MDSMTARCTLSSDCSATSAATRSGGQRGFPLALERQSILSPHGIRKSEGGGGGLCVMEDRESFKRFESATATTRTYLRASPQQAARALLLRRLPDGTVQRHATKRNNNSSKRRCEASSSSRQRCETGHMPLPLLSSTLQAGMLPLLSSWMLCYPAGGDRLREDGLRTRCCEALPCPPMKAPHTLSTEQRASAAG